MTSNAQTNLQAGAVPSGAPDPGGFAAGFGPMDRIHREFHGLIAGLGDAGDEGEKLLALHEHLLRQCAQEERWMRESGFPASDGHLREHEMLLEVVSEVRRRFDAGDSEVVVRLAEELPQWFEAHNNTMDAGLAVHLRSLGYVADLGNAAPRKEAATA